ncbi:MAG: hypothetical protein WBM24_11735 [Candidatus Sulfotelmatobacter sp.]
MESTHFHPHNVRNLYFGQAVAEHDEGLNNYFLRTSAYWAMVQDDTDIILGAKGTGKSAIARYLSTDHANLDGADDLIIIPAFNLQGSALFKRLSDAADAEYDETAYRELFLAYLIGLIGNHLIRDQRDNPTVASLNSVLTQAGLAVAEPTTQKVWRRVLARLRPKLSTKLAFDAVGHPVVSGSVEVTSTTDEAEVAETAPSISLDALESILEQVYGCLDTLDMRCWIVFDRLDEAFPDDRDLERVALRGLLRAHLDACSYGNRLRAKLFLRLDLFDRIIRSDFVNADHLRVSRISWDSDSIFHLVALRLIDPVKGPAHDRLEQEISTPKGRMALCRSILPRKVDNQDALVWLLIVTTDASREYNPRNVLTLLRFARHSAMQIANRDTGLSSQLLTGRRSDLWIRTAIESQARRYTICGEFFCT